MSKTDAHSDPKNKRQQDVIVPYVVDSDNKWTNEEETKLLTLVDTKEDITWHKVSKHFPGKSGAACQARWEELIKRDGKKGNWTSEEDEQLKLWVVSL